MTEKFNRRSVLKGILGSGGLLGVKASEAVGSPPDNIRSSMLDYVNQQIKEIEAVKTDCSLPWPVVCWSDGRAECDPNYKRPNNVNFVRFEAFILAQCNDKAIKQLGCLREHNRWITQAYEEWQNARSQRSRYRRGVHWTSDVMYLIGEELGLWISLREFVIAIISGKGDGA